MLHTIAAIPLVLLALFYAPIEVADDEEVEVFAEGTADGAPGPLVDDAVLTVTVLDTVQDWDATAVTDNPTDAAKGEDKPPQAEKADPAAKAKDEGKDRDAAEKTKDGARKDEGGGEDGGGEDATTAGGGDGSNKPNPKAQSSSKKPKKVCPPNLDIARVETWEYAVERDLVERYAKDLKALGRIARVSSHESASGAPDGFRLGLPQCSPLRQAGLRTGDVVKDVNGRKIHNVMQAVGAYFTLRNERKFTVHVERKGQIITLRYSVDRGVAQRVNAEQAATATPAPAATTATPRPASR